MSVEVNGIAHIQLTVNDPDKCLPFWEQLCHFLEMETLNLTVTEDGKTLIDPEGDPVRCATEWRDKEAFLDLLTERLA